ncbi:hypothetical protein JCM13304A_09520 [Desulfothermus okinawensis JCM 13304]
MSASCARSFDLELLKKGAMKGRDVDEYLYGRELVLGEYPVEKKMEGIRYLKKSAIKGYAPAIIFLAQMYEKGIDGIKKDFVESYRWYKKGEEIGLEVAKIKLAPLHRSEDSNKDFRLFGIVLKGARRFALSYVLQKNGAQPIRIDTGSFCDIFSSEKLLQGTDKMQVCYSPDGEFALLEYRYPPKGVGYDRLLTLWLEKLKKKYGNPKEIRINNLIDRYVWEKQGILIYFWMEPKTNTCFLRYVDPAKYKELYKLYLSKKMREKLSTIEFF